MRADFVVVRDITTRFVRAAAAYAEQCDLVARLGRDARAIPCADPEQPEDVYGDAGAVRPLTCFDAMPDEQENGYLTGTKVLWHKATPEQCAHFCEGCKRRAAIYKHRHEERKRLGGLKAAMMRALRACPQSVAASPATHADVSSEGRER